MGYGFVLQQEGQVARPWQRIRAQRLDQDRQEELAARCVAAVEEGFPQLAGGITATCDFRGVVTLAGECETYQQLTEVAHLVAKLEGVRNVVSDLTAADVEIPRRDYTAWVEQGEAAGELAECDVVVVGLGIVGAAICRELSRYDLDVIAVEAAEDVACGASKANNGGVHHAGGVKPGTLKAEMSVLGNRKWDQLADELGFDFNRCGDLLYIEDPDDIDELADEFKTAVRNGDWRPRLIDGAQCLEIEPALATYGRKPVMGLWMPSQGRVHTYEVAVALAENAAANGVRVLLNTPVCRVECERVAGTADGEENSRRITGVLTAKGLIRCRYVVNAAGAYSDDVSAMAGDRLFTIHPRRGTIAIVDKARKPMFEHLTGYMNPEKKQGRDPNSKGGGMEFTPSGNILIGPSAKEVPDKEDTRTTAEELGFIWAINENPEVTQRDIIRLFAGSRPADYSEDFQIGMSEVCHGLVQAGAIQSPGVGSSPAIAEMVAGIICDDSAAAGRPVGENPTFNPRRERPVRLRELSHEERDALIAERPEYGRIVCRCEGITEGEILDVLRAPVVPTSIDGIKRRCRAGMGRCQGGFCQPRVLEIIARELGMEPTEVCLHGPGSEVLRRDNRDCAQGNCTLGGTPNAQRCSAEEASPHA